MIEGGKLTGALMIGERALRVRAIGRNMKRLIDAAVDVSEIKHRLLEPSFDVEAWLERKRLVERPAPPRTTTVFAAAKLKRTQALSLNSAAATGAMSEFLAPHTGGTVALKRAAISTQQSGLTTALPSSPGGPGGMSSSASSGQTVALPSGPRKTRLLSIGLHAESAPEARGSLAPIDARLEFQGRALPITLPVTNLGQSPECQIPLADRA